LQNKIFYKGIFYTCLASLFWGIPQPLFFNELKFVPAIEVAFHRGLWSFIFLLIVIILLGRIKDFFEIFFSYRKLLVLSFTGILISINWTGFIMAVNFNRVQDASMGYYLTPLISIGLGYFFLNEKISSLKLLSVIIMSSSIIYLIFTLNTIPFLAMLIGTTWGIYGLLRKQINVSPEIGLLYESGFITLIAAPYLIYLNFYELGFFLNDSFKTSNLLILTGVVTIFPLFFFNLGVKFIPLSFAGVIFYLAPTFHFFTSVFILNEPLATSKLISFVIIWIAVIIFIFDIISEDKKINVSNIQ